MKKTFIYLCFVLIIMSLSSFDNQRNIKKPKKPKYIFILIGDGMGITQTTVTNRYLKTIGEEPLAFTLFPNFALTTTDCMDTTKITDSAAAGTAIACGRKTHFSALDIDTIKGENFNSIAENLKIKDWKIGIISSVSLNHATPAAFYANSEKRNNYFDIAMQLPESNFDFFAGGGINIPDDSAALKKFHQKLIAANYQVIDSAVKYNKNQKYNDKIFYSIPNILNQDKALSYYIDNKDKKILLRDFVDFGIDFLDTEKNFFMMVEGGKIDWACHGNDIATVVNEVIDFNLVVEEVLEFYYKHKEETLVIVTADHETGGLSFGATKTGYNVNIKDIAAQTYSFEYVLNIFNSAKKEDYIKIIYQYFGITADESYIDEKTVEKLAKKVLKDFNNKAGIAWGTEAHTGTPVGTYAIGVGSEKFNGLIDNTDIVKKIYEILEFKE